MMCLGALIAEPERSAERGRRRIAGDLYGLDLPGALQALRAKRRPINLCVSVESSTSDIVIMGRQTSAHRHEGREWERVYGV